KKLDIYDDERPIGIQIFGGDETAMARSADIVEKRSPEVLDINYGCPVKNVVCRNAGAGILRDLDKMVRLTALIVKSTTLPVTVKTRLGWDENSIRIAELAERLQDVGIQAISIHCRTRHQMYTGKADWSWIARVKENPRLHIPVFGNGDVDSPEKAKEMISRYGADGVMIGRAAIGYPWIFREIKFFFETGKHLAPPTLDERIEAALTHLKRSVAWKGIKLGILEMRRHYGSYFKGFENIKQFRSRLVTAETPSEVEGILGEIHDYYTLHPEFVNCNVKQEVEMYAGID
ncbi:MAG: tRNA-dihydrouridine synthase, partial [Chitinophagales bacterium]|nr:tRNA-dihydrouridine synthase [Chitinophagales bacterium]